MTANLVEGANDNRGRSAWLVLAIVAVTICIALPWLSADYGMTYDEQSRYAHGRRVVSYLRGELPELANRETGGHLYGGLFDVSANWVYDTFGGNVWVTRHRVNAAVGALGIVATGLLAARLMSPWAGILAMMMLALSPRYVGHAMNNPKDIPFAAFTMVALLSFALLRTTPPFFSWLRAIAIGLALALPLNVRPGALVYLAYFGLCVLVLVVRARAWSVRQLAPVAARLLVVAAVMFVAGSAFWPWAQQNPFVRPLLTLRSVTDFNWGGTILFNGQDLGRDVPWSYLPTWMAITIPPVVLAGAALSVPAAVQHLRHGRTALAGLWGVATFPLVVAITRGATLYDGWRHLMFVYPPVVVLAVGGWIFLIHQARSRGMRMAGLALVVAGCLEPMVFMLRNHPNEVVYFNALVGGPRGAWRRFDLDYWGNSLLQAMDWTAGLARDSGVPLCVSGRPYSLIRGNVERFRSLYTKWPHENAHHVEVVLGRGPRDALAALDARPDILHVIRTADGAPLAYVVPGPKFDEVRARVVHATMRRRNPDS